MNPNVQLTITPGSLVFVTGANGYIASHIINQLLQFGYRVRGTVRSSKPWLTKYFQEKFGQDCFQEVVLPSFEDAGKLRREMAGVSGVIHVASDMSFSPDVKSVVTGVVESTLSVLRAAAEIDSVNRFVLTSSAVAACMRDDFAIRGVTIDQDSWSQAVVDQAFSPTLPEIDRPRMAYMASKVEGERAAWRWVQESKPRFEFNTVLPHVTFGRVLHPLQNGSTMGLIAALLDGDTSAFIIPPPWFVDVEDVARLHSVALLSREVRSERLFACAERFNWGQLISVLKKIYPQNQKLPSVEDPALYQLDAAEILPAARAEKLISTFFNRERWTTLEESLDCALHHLAA